GDALGRPADVAVRDLELGTASTRAMGTLRTEVRHPHQPGLRLQRDRLDRRPSWRGAPAGYRRHADSLPRAADRGCRGPRAAVRRNWVGGTRWLQGQ